MKITKHEKEESDSDVEMNLIVKRFIRFLKLEKKGYSSKGKDLHKKDFVQEVQAKSRKTNSKSHTIIRVWRDWTHSS